MSFDRNSCAALDPDVLTRPRRRLTHASHWPARGPTPPFPCSSFRPASGERVNLMQGALEQSVGCGCAQEVHKCDRLHVVPSPHHLSQKHIVFQIDQGPPAPYSNATLDVSPCLHRPHSSQGCSAWKLAMVCLKHAHVHVLRHSVCTTLVLGTLVLIQGVCGDHVKSTRRNSLRVSFCLNFEEAGFTVCLNRKLARNFARGT
jgi:hypothetical protein